MHKKNKALISGITGQDGSYLTEFMIEKGYEVHGLVRPVSSFNRNRLDKIYLNPDLRNAVGSEMTNLSSRFCALSVASVA